MQQRLAIAVEALGLLLVSLAGLTVHPGLALTIAGVGLVLFGLAVERG